MDATDFMSKYDHIIKLIQNPKSFVKEEEPKECKDPLEKITKTIESLSIQHNDEKALLIAVCDVLNNETGDFKLTPDVLGLMIQICAIPEACMKFQTNALFEKHKDDETEPNMYTIVQCMTCYTCGKLATQHKACALYQAVGKDNSLSPIDDACFTCGLSKYEHKVCGQYKYGPNDVVEDKCMECHLPHMTHIIELQKMGKETCYDFKNDGHNYCTNCLIDKTSHCYSTLYRQLNKNVQSEISIITLQMQVMCISDPIYCSTMKILNDLFYISNYTQIFNLLP